MTVAEIEAAIEAGRLDWASGADLPPWPADEVTPSSMRWVGFIEARSRDFFRRRAMALYPDRVEPRP